MKNKNGLLFLGFVLGAAAATAVWVHQNPEKVEALKSQAQKKADELGAQLQQHLAEFQAAVKTATETDPDQS